MTERNKVLKQKKEQEKIEEQQLWDKLNTLNKESGLIGNIKKRKKMSKAILK